MMRAMRQRLLYIAWTAALTLFMPALALAADDEGVIPNAKAMGYKVKVVVPDRSTTVVWLLFFLLAAVCIAAVFKNAKRSHLD